MNVAFLGASKILNKVIEIFNNYKDKFTLYGISSRDIERSKEYAQKYNILNVYNNYLEMVQDPNIDLVYISTTTNLHYEHMKLCLENNKNVIVEKSFTTNYKDTLEVINLAKSKNLFLEEAIWTRFMPSREFITQILNLGIIGEPYLIEANLGYDIKNVERLQKPELGGGALLDVGVYPINFIDMFARAIEKDNEVIKTDVTAKMNGLGVDQTVSGCLTYKNGIIGNFFATMNNLTSREGFIYCKDGFIKVININNPERVEVYQKDANDGHKLNLVSSLEIKNDVNGYEYEFLEAYVSIKSNQIETKSMPLSDTLRIMKIQDEILRIIGSKVE